MDDNTNDAETTHEDANIAAAEALLNAAVDQGDRGRVDLADRLLKVAQTEALISIAKSLHSLQDSIGHKVWG